MKMNLLTGRIATVVLLAGVLSATSCDDEDRLTLTDTQDITEEAVTDSYFQDLDDMAAVAINTPDDDEYSGGRRASSITINDNRFCVGAVVTIVPGETSTVESPNGILTVDFGTIGCTDSRGNTRSGKLIFTYNKRRFQPGSTITTTTDNYIINGVRLEGTRTLTNVAGSTSDAPKFNAVLDNGKATFLADESVATRESNITWQWSRGATAAEDFLTIDQTSVANGTTRGGRDYSVSLSEALKYKRNCGIAVDGIKNYLIDNAKAITIDYGNGECDRSIVITVNGVSRNLNVD
jgi:hypothetical protein